MPRTTPHIRPRSRLSACLLAGAACVLGACDETAAPVIEAQTLAPVTVEASVKRDAPLVAESQDMTLSQDPAGEGAIVLNQVGFNPYWQKHAFLIRSNPAPVAFTVLDAAGTVVFEGTSENLGLHTNTNQSLHRLDFTGLDDKGRGYQLRVGTTQSDPFDILSRPYHRLAKDALSYFYQMRSGEPVEAAYVPEATPPLSRPAGHVGETLTCFAGTDLRGTVWPGCTHEQFVQGGWYDAGDYGKYTVNAGIATWKLLNLYEWNKGRNDNCAVNFSDGALAFPQNMDGRNDLLNEAFYGVIYILRSQITTTDPVAVARGNQPATGPLTLSSINAFGMAHHKSHSLQWGSDNVAPVDDTLPRALYPPSTAATLHVAAVGAQCARVYKNIDPGLSKLCMDRAVLAWDAANQFPDIYSYDNFTGGGPYNDTSLQDEFAWAANELFLTTGDAQYNESRARNLPDLPGRGDFGWQYVAPLVSLGTATRALRKNPSARTTFETAAVSAITVTADGYMGEKAQNRFGVPYANQNYYWGSNGTHLNRAMILGAAYDLTGDTRFKTGVVDMMDYIMGRNGLGQSYVTGYGSRPVERPHHRFWANSVNAALPKPPPGILSGGPNNTAMIDPTAMRISGTCRGANCWADEFDAYSLNEVAINWNSSLVWAAHWLDTKEATCAERPYNNPDVY